MSIILFVPAIVCGVVTISLLLNVEKDDEWLGKIWSLVFAVVFFFATVFFTDLTFKNNDRKAMKNVKPTQEFYDSSHDYIY